MQGPHFKSLPWAPKVLLAALPVCSAVHKGGITVGSHNTKEGGL